MEGAAVRDWPQHVLRPAEACKVGRSKLRAACCATEVLLDWRTLRELRISASTASEIAPLHVARDPNASNAAGDGSGRRRLAQCVSRRPIMVVSLRASSCL